MTRRPHPAFGDPNVSHLLPPHLSPRPPARPPTPPPPPPTPPRPPSPNQPKRKPRPAALSTPTAVGPKTSWPPTKGADFTLPTSLEPLEPFRKQTLTLHGVCDKVRGDGDAHMRGSGCLPTGGGRNPGNAQGGSPTPAGLSRRRVIEHA